MQVTGCLMIDSKVLKSSLVPLAHSAQEDVKAVLNDTARASCKAVYEDLVERNAKLADRGDDLDSFMAYQELHNEMHACRTEVLRSAERVRR